MKLKLKKLHEVLAMYPEYKVNSRYIFLDDVLTINSSMLPEFGKEQEVTPRRDSTKYQYYIGTGSYHESWFEPIPEKEQWYQVVAHFKQDSRPFTYSSLNRSKEEFLEHMTAKESDFHWIKLIPVNLEE